MTNAAIRVAIILGVGCLTWAHSAHALTGWVCSETPSNLLPGLPTIAEIQKYEISGNRLETVPNISTVIDGTQMAPSFTYQIVTNDPLGLVAVLTDVKKYDSGPEVWADIIIIDKTRDTIRHFSGSTTGQRSTVETGPCTTY